MEEYTVKGDTGDVLATASGYMYIITMTEEKRKEESRTQKKVCGAFSDGYNLLLRCMRGTVHSLDIDAHVTQP